MRPSIYGYMRVAACAPDTEEIQRITAELSEFAEAEGFALDQVFVEQLASNDSAFDVMIERLKSAETKDVLVPSLWHFARLPGLQDAMRAHIERETGARIWVIQGQRR